MRKISCIILFSSHFVLDLGNFNYFLNSVAKKIITFDICLYCLYTNQKMNKKKFVVVKSQKTTCTVYLQSIMMHRRYIFYDGK